MKKSKKLLSLVSLFFLVSCGGGGEIKSNTEEITTAQGSVETTTIQTDDTTEQTTVEEITSDETTSDEQKETTSDEQTDEIKYDVNIKKGESKWSESENETFLNAFGLDGGYVPFIGITNYDFEYDASYQCVSVYGVGAASNLEAYNKAATQLGYIIEEDSWYENSYYAYGYYNENGDGITINFYLGSDDSGSESYFCLDIFHHKYIKPESIRTEWTAAEKTMIDGAFGEGIADMVPCYVPAGSELIDGIEDYGMLYVYYMNGGLAEVAEASAMLEKAGFLYDETFDEYYKMLTDTKGLYVSPYLDIYGEFNYTIQVYDENAEEGGETDVPTGDRDIEVSGDWFIRGSDLTGVLEKTSYGTTSFEFGGVNYACENFCYNIFGDTTVLQLKKKVGFFYNTTALSTGLDQIQISIHDETVTEGDVTVYSSTDGTTWNEIAGVDGVYDFDGETYFKIANLSGKVVYIDAIGFTNVK